jgi:gas vesicle protein
VPPEHKPYLFLTTVALAALALLGLAGCQTPPQTAAPAYGTMVPPPATGMMGQPAPYGANVSMPQGAAYPASAPMTTAPPASWQGAAPAAPSLTAPNNSWTWSQSSPPTTAPSAQQYGNQMQAQPQQWMNSTQQSLANQQQQMTNQLQNTAQQYNNQMNQTLQQQQQQLSGQMQQYTNQMTPQMQQAMPQQQTVNGNWWPFQSPNGMPPARATPALPARY